MGYYKIENITNTLPKRHMFRDKDITVRINDGLKQKQWAISTGQIVLIECTKLPIDIQKARIKGYIIVQDISKKEYINGTQFKVDDIIALEREVKKSEDNKKKTQSKSTSQQKETTTKATSKSSKSTTSKKSSTEKEEDDLEDEKDK